MSGPYNNFNQHFGLLPPYYDLSENGHQVMGSAAYVRTGGMQSFQTQQPDSLNARFIDFDDVNHPLLPAQGSSRVRRRVGSAGEHVKFRRTRSGCYTCRNRRVKCDENRPICERCRKGSRECLYPETNVATKPRRNSTKSKSTPECYSSPDSQQHDDAQDPDEDTMPYSKLALSDTSASSSVEREPSNTPSLTQGSAETTDQSPTKEVVPNRSFGDRRGQASRTRSMSSKRWSELPRDVRFYIQYARNNLSPHHWTFLQDGSNFLSTSLIEASLRFEPLLYAVVGFAAYHHTLTKPNGKIQDFLKYYTISVSLLRQSLTNGQRHTVATILTILQLATIEEYLGDWVNLMGHQNAAYHIITELYTPDTIMRTGTLRNILKWYIHFEIYVSMLSGSPAVITRDWFEAQHKHYFSRVEEVPDDLNARYDEQHAWIRLIGHDISLLFRRKIEGTIPDEEFAATSSSLQSRLNEWEDNIHPMLTDKSKLVVDFSNALPREPNNIVDPNKPGVIYGGDLYPTNLVILNFLGLKNMFDTRLAAFVGTSFSEEAKHRLGYRLIQMVDSLQYWSGSPPGILIGLRANFAIAVLMLPIRKEEIQWARERFAKIEVQGYLFPASIRTKLEQIWGEDLSSWWLPNEEDFPPITRSIRAFNIERSATPRDEKGENLRDMKGLFRTLVLDQSSSPESAGNLTFSADPSPVGEKPYPDIRTGGPSEQMPYDEFEWQQNESPELSTWGFEQQEQQSQNQGFDSSLF